VTHPAAEARAFNIGLADMGDHREWIARFGAALDWTGEVAEAPAPPDSPLAALDLTYPLIADTGAFRTACGWREPTALEDALARTIDDERRRG
jgi:nucleoside-diphosphate-sugar epimerase